MRFENISGMPTSREMTSAISGLRSARPSAMAAMNFERSSRSVKPQVWKASLAAWTARSTSSAVPSGMWPITSSVLASMTSIVPEPVDGTHAPLM